jgi:hypothetical protein
MLGPLAAYLYWQGSEKERANVRGQINRQIALGRQACRESFASESFCKTLRDSGEAEGRSRYSREGQATGSQGFPGEQIGGKGGLGGEGEETGRGCDGKSRIREAPGA